MKKTFDIISVGDATLDVFLEISEATVSCKLNTDDCQFCINYADKIPVDTVTRVPGSGNASNNAVGSSRLGMKTAIVSILGNDETGGIILDRWKKEKVGTRHVSMDRNHGTNYSTVLNFQGERTILVYHEPRTYRFPKALGAAEWIYYTSLGKGSESMHEGLLSYIKKHDVKLAFQPGTYQLKLGREQLKPIFAASEIVFVNKEEAERIVEDGVRSMKDLLTHLHDMGCRVAVITDG